MEVKTSLQNTPWWTPIPLWHLWNCIPSFICTEESQDYPYGWAPTCLWNMQQVIQAEAGYAETCKKSPPGRYSGAGTKWWSHDICITSRLIWIIVKHQIFVFPQFNEFSFGHLLFIYFFNTWESSWNLEFTRTYS